MKDEIVRIPENSPKFKEWERRQRYGSGCLSIIAVAILTSMLILTALGG